MSTHAEIRKWTLPALAEAKRNRRKLVMLTAYDYSFARVVDANGVDLVLIGDSLGMVVQGRDSTLPVTVEHIAYHTAAVARGLERAMLVARVEQDAADRKRQAVALETGIRQLLPPDRREALQATEANVELIGARLQELAAPGAS